MNDLSLKEINDMLCNSKFKLSDQEVEELWERRNQLISSAGLPPKEIEAMLNKPSRDRYIYAVKNIASNEAAWTLKDTNDDDLVIMKDDEGYKNFFIWSHKEYALKCTTGEWEKFELLELSLDRLLNDILPDFQKDGVDISVFESPEDPSVASVSAKDFLNNLLYEHSQYE